MPTPSGLPSNPATLPINSLSRFTGDVKTPRPSARPPPPKSGSPDGPPTFGVGRDGSIDWLLVAVRCTGAVLIVPVMEELFWRSFLMRWVQRPGFVTVDPTQVGLRAVLISTFMFVLVHPLWLAAALAGLAYAWLYVRTGRLWTSVIAHAVTNGALGAWVVFTGNWGYW